MIRLIVIIILMFEIGILTSNCQEKFSYDVLGSANYCYRDIKTNDVTKNYIIDLREESEKAKISYKVGVDANFHLKKSYISIGLLFSNKGYQTKLITETNLIHPLYGPIYSTNTTSATTTHEKFTIKYNYLYLDIPFFFSYIFFDKKIKLFVSAGLQGNILMSVQHKTVLYYADGSTEEQNNKDNHDNEKINFSIEGGIGIEFPIANKLNIIVEPYYERNISTTIQAPIKEYLFSIGLNVKLRYK